MAHLIDKDALVAEIKDRIRRYKEYIDSGYNYEERKQELEYLLSSIDTLEVKEVELEKEINGYFKGWGDNEVGCFAMMQDGTSVGVDDCIDIAKHFFELGLKAQKL